MSISELPQTLTPAEISSAYQKGIEFRLPSGMNARLRPVTSRDLLKHLGRIPDELTGLVSMLINPPADEGEEELSLADRIKQIDPEMMERQLLFLDEYCKIAFISPRIVDNPKPDTDELSPEWISEEDKGFVLALINTSVADLKRFRQFQIESYSGVESESGLSPTSEPDLPDSGDGAELTV